MLFRSVSCVPHLVPCMHWPRGHSGTQGVVYFLVQCLKIFLCFLRLDSSHIHLRGKPPNSSKTLWLPFPKLSFLCDYADTIWIPEHHFLVLWLKIQGFFFSFLTMPHTSYHQADSWLDKERRH